MNCVKRIKVWKKIENAQKDQSTVKKVNRIEIYNSKTIREFETIEEIGYGASGKVLKVALKKYYAMKIMSMENATIDNLKHFIGEYEIMNLLNQQFFSNIVLLILPKPSKINHFHLFKLHVLFIK